MGGGEHRTNRCCSGGEREVKSMCQLLIEAVSRCCRGLLVVAATMVLHGCAVPRASTLVFYDGPHRTDQVAALNGFRECGFLVGNLRVGHWMTYQIRQGGLVEVRADAYYGRNGEREGVYVRYEPANFVMDVTAYRDGVEEGFVRVVDENGALRNLGYYRDGVRVGWYYNFEGGVRRFYEDGNVVREERLGSGTSGLEMFK